jgi:hypothetical protein
MKELLVEDHALGGETSLDGETLQTKLKIWYERIEIICDAARNKWNYAVQKFSENDRTTEYYEKIMSEWSRLVLQIKKLTEDYNNLAKGGFEERLKQIMD